MFFFFRFSVFGMFFFRFSARVLLQLLLCLLLLLLLSPNDQLPLSTTMQATKRGLRIPNPNSRDHAAKRGLRVPNPNSRGHATKCGLRVPNPNSRSHATKRGKEKQERKKERSTVFAPERIWRCTWAGVLLRMQDIHFATNDICIAARLANLPLESTSQQTTFV